MKEMSQKTKDNAIHTALSYNQGNIAGLDDAMTRRLVASTVGTESSGGNLSAHNAQGYSGRYQAGAAWLAEAGYVDKKKLDHAMKQDGYSPSQEWTWATHGGMTKFLKDPSNWKHGLSLEQYMGSAELQDKAFKTNCDKTYKAAIDNHLLTDKSSPEEIAGYLKAAHIGGAKGARQVVTKPANTKLAVDANHTSSRDYYNNIVHNTDKLDEPFNKAYAQFKQTGHIPSAPASKDHPKVEKSPETQPKQSAPAGTHPPAHKENTDGISLSSLYADAKKSFASIADKFGMGDHPSAPPKAPAVPPKEVPHPKTHASSTSEASPQAKPESVKPQSITGNYTPQQPSHPHSETPSQSRPVDMPAMSEKAQQFSQQAERQISSLNQHNQLGLSNEDIRQIAGKLGSFAQENKANHLDYVYISQNSQTGEKIVSAQFDGFKDFRQPVANAISPEQPTNPTNALGHSAPQVERSAASRSM